MQNNTITLAGILLLFAAALYIALPIDHPAWLEEGLAPGENTQRDIRDMTLGLDLKGGTQVLLEVDLPEGQKIESGALSTAKVIVEQRVNGLGVSEPNVQLQGETRIIVELPGVSNPDQAINTIRSTGQLEFIEPAGERMAGGEVINTTNRPDAVTRAQASDSGSAAFTPFPDRVFETVMTGDILSQAIASQDEFNQWQIQFSLTGDGSNQFFEYTRNHIGDPLVIVLDGRVLSAPVINAAISDNGVITGQFSREEAESLAVQMRYGALPVPLAVVDVRTIGASLGHDSVDASLTAGIIGMAMVLLFMLILYRLPG
ncbi:MAG TPA: hypothetical protein PL105_24970, partial [Caldilineaceae bacterium]|nr:hypothetical protein [Caldilineaceae bacterium]